MRSANTSRRSRGIGIVVVVVVVMVVIAGLAAPARASAIPMWEYLSRGEKMNHLYNMFVKQVNEYCDSVSMPDCNSVLLLYGLNNLAKMGEESLDKMDPYQRGATGIIWDSMMKGKHKSSGSIKEGSEYETNDHHTETYSESVNNSVGSKEEASTNIQEFVPPGSSKYIMGPMVMRLLPNGSPVPGDQPLPHVKDEDAEEFKLMQSQPSHNIDGLAIKNGSDSIKEGNRKSVTFTDGNQQTGAVYSNPSLPYDIV